jgi:Ca-activated chloride channel homolog
MIGRLLLVCSLLTGPSVAFVLPLVLFHPVRFAREASHFTGQSAESAPRTAGTRLYIAAFRDSRLFTLCPPPASIGEPDRPVPRDPNGVTIFRSKDKLWVHVWPTGENAVLPPPPALGVPSTGILRELDGRLPSWDEQTAVATAAAVSQSKVFSVVDSPDVADDVLLVESSHQTVASFSSPSGGIDQVGGDRAADFLEALFGVLVPAGEYQAHGPDAAALLPARLWNGVVMARRVGAGNAPLANLAGPTPASVDSLVKQLAGRSLRPPNFPPICSASEAPATQQPQQPVPFVRIDANGRSEVERIGRSTVPVSAAPTFTSGVTYVSLPVVVRDADGRGVPGLVDVDFRVYEDNAEQKVEQVLPTSSVIDVAIAVDTSSSMRLEWPQLRNAIVNFVERLHADDRIMLASFSDRVLAQSEFTPDHDLLRRTLSEISRGQGTRLYDAVSLITTERLQAVRDRKALVLFTDGVDTRSRLATAEGTEALLSESHPPVYVVQYDTRRDDYTLPSGARVNGMSIREMSPTILPDAALDNSRLFARADAYLSAVASLSGGRVFDAETLVSVDDAFAQVARELRDQYTLVYRPSNQTRDGTFRSVRVDVNRPDIQVRARAGYRAPSRR